MELELSTELIKNAYESWAGLSGGMKFLSFVILYLGIGFCFHHYFMHKTRQVKNRFNALKNRQHNAIWNPQEILNMFGFCLVIIPFVIIAFTTISIVGLVLWPVAVIASLLVCYPLDRLYNPIKFIKEMFDSGRQMELPVVDEDTEAIRKTIQRYSDRMIDFRTILE